MKKLIFLIALCIQSLLLCEGTKIVIKNDLPKNATKNQMNSSSQKISPDIELDTLINNLFTGYKKKVKPVGVVNIKFSLIIEQIVEMVAKDELMVLNAWINQEWVDSRLRWNPLDFHNVTSFQVASDMVWTPDTFM